NHCWLRNGRLLESLMCSGSLPGWERWPPGKIPGAAHLVAEGCYRPGICQKNNKGAPTDMRIAMAGPRRLWRSGDSLRRACRCRELHDESAAVADGHRHRAAGLHPAAAELARRLPVADHLARPRTDERQVELQLPVLLPGVDAGHVPG